MKVAAVLPEMNDEVTWFPFPFKRSPASPSDWTLGLTSLYWVTVVVSSLVMRAVGIWLSDSSSSSSASSPRMYTQMVEALSWRRMVVQKITKQISERPANFIKRNPIVNNKMS